MKSQVVVTILANENWVGDRKECRLKCWRQPQGAHRWQEWERGSRVWGREAAECHAEDLTDSTRRPEKV